jgi:hypothetical protein
MQRVILTFLVLTFLLTACGTLDVTLVSGDEPTPTPASDSLAAGPVPLSMDSTSGEIRQLLLESPFRWQTIFMDAQVAYPDGIVQRKQVWVDQPALSFRVLSGAVDSSAEALRVVDSTSQLDLNITTGESSISPFLDGSTTVPYTPQAPTLSDNSVVPHPLSASVDSHLGVLIFPSEIAQNEGTFKPVAMEVIAYRLVLAVEWTYTKNDLPTYRAWVDVSTGVLLRYQQFEKSGGTDVLSEVTITRVDYDLSFPSDFFSPVVSAMPDFASEPLALASLAVPPAAFVGEDADPLGWVYSFVADNSYPVRVMRLVRLPASCAIGASDCPEAEIIPMPVELTSSLQPLVWSSTRNEAAWAYPVNADQRIWTLYLFDPLDKTWKELVQMDRYMDPPMWSRDGAWLAFRVQDGQGGEAIYAVRRDGSDLKNLTDSEELPAEGRPYVMDAWLGENVVLRSGKPGGAGTIYLMRVGDGFVKPLFETLLTKAPFIESPDGTLLAYVDYDYNSQKQLVKIITPDGKTLRDLATFASGSVMGLAWSPDGAQLGFSHRTDSTSSVYVIDSDGRNLRQLFISTTDTQFVFSPDGKYILIQTIDGTGEHLYAIDLSTLQSHLVQAPGIPLNESWMFPTWKK